MQIRSTNTSTPVVAGVNSPSFNGKILIKGKWTPGLKKTFLDNKAVQDYAAKSEKDLVALMSRRHASKNEFNHNYGQHLYKLTMFTQKESPSICDKLKAFFGFINKFKVTHQYHSESGMQVCMDLRLTDKLLNYKLGNPNQ